MSRLSPNAPCPCTSGLKYKKCCGRIHLGQSASTPEALMRSRYSAYALGLVEHILHTTHPDGPHFQADTARWRDEVQTFCESATFVRLEVLEAEAREDRGIVLFRAYLAGPGGSAILAERSFFLREEGRWLYHSGTRLEE